MQLPPGGLVVVAGPTFVNVKEKNTGDWPENKHLSDADDTCNYAKDLRPAYRHHMDHIAVGVVVAAVVVVNADYVVGSSHKSKNLEVNFAVT